MAFFLLGLVLSLAVGAAATGQPANPADALVSAYYDALRSGDVDGMARLIGGRLLRQQQALLSNPTYSEHLLEAYGDRSFSITEHSQTADANRIVVEVEETIAADERIRLQYVLEWSSEPGNSGFRIVDVVAVP
jgi:hypothetical protein